MRLKRGAARAMDCRTGAQSHEGPRASRLVIHIRSKTWGPEVNEQAAVSNQAIPRKALKYASKGASGSSKKKVSFGPLKESLPTLRNMFLALLMRFWWG